MLFRSLGNTRVERVEGDTAGCSLLPWPHRGRAWPWEGAAGTGAADRSGPASSSPAIDTVLAPMRWPQTTWRGLRRAHLPFLSLLGNLQAGTTASSPPWRSSSAIASQSGGSVAWASALRIHPALAPELTLRLSAPPAESASRSCRAGHSCRASSEGHKPGVCADTVIWAGVQNPINVEVSRVGLPQRVHQHTRWTSSERWQVFSDHSRGFQARWPAWHPT